MKKLIILALSSVFVIALLSGCARKVASDNGKQALNDNTVSSNINESNNLNMDQLKKMDDNQLIENISKGEDNAALDDTNSIDSQIKDLDSILNDQDPMGDIPSNINVNK